MIFENVVEIEELSPIIGESEIYENELKDKIVTTSSKVDANYRKLENAVREITLRYRVIFGIRSFYENTVRLNSADFS